MRRALPVFALTLSIAALARADAALVAVPSPALPLDVSMIFDGDTEHGCSQSHESIGERATLRLRLDPRGNAELEIDRQRDEVFGPSLGEFRRGRRDFSHTHEREVHHYRGRATLAGGAIEVGFDRDRRAQVRWSGYGQPPALTPVDTPTQVRMRCRVEAVDVYPSGRLSFAQPGETAQAVPLLRCEFPSGAPDGLGMLVEAGGALTLGRAGGVTQRYARRFGRRGSLFRLP